MAEKKYSEAEIKEAIEYFENLLNETEPASTSILAEHFKLLISLARQGLGKKITLERIEEILREGIDCEYFHIEQIKEVSKAIYQEIGGKYEKR